MLIATLTIDTYRGVLVSSLAKKQVTNMTIKYIKKANKNPSTEDHKTRSVVENILKDIEKRKEDAIKEITKKFDNYEGQIVISKEKIEEANKKVDEKRKVTYNLLTNV